MSEQLSSFEQQREALAEKLKLREQYEQQIKTLNEIGILEILPDSQELGIVGIDGKGYPIPTHEQILQRITPEKVELLTKKFEQGFTKLLLVPFAMSLGTLIKRYERELLKHDEEGKLLSTIGIKLELDRKGPIYIWEGYQNADILGELVYEPQEFSPKHQGKTKKEFLQERGPWLIIMVEDLPDLPAEHKGKTIEGRKQLEANKSAVEYLKILQKNPQYQGERGFNPEMELTLWLTTLHTENQVVDDWQGQGKASYLTGSYFKRSGMVPSVYWDRGNRQAGVGRDRPGYHDSNGSARTRVEV
jgi:hypothetical protein